jgi:hypothetical protein
VTIWKSKNILEIIKNESFFIEDYELGVSLKTHIKIIKEFKDFLIEIPHFVLLLFILFTVYRIKYIIKKMNKKNVMKEFKEIVYDTFPILLSIFLLILTPWKILIWWRIIFIENDNKKRRNDLYEMAAWVIVGIYNISHRFNNHVSIDCVVGNNMESPIFD